MTFFLPPLKSVGSPDCKQRIIIIVLYVNGLFLTSDKRINYLPQLLRASDLQ